MDIKELETESLHKLIATKRVLHTPIDVITSELKISKKKLYNILATDEYKAVLKQIAEEATSHAVMVWRASMEGLITESHRVLRARLKEDDLEAVKVVLKSIGVDQQAPQQQATSLTVVLPDMNQEKKSDVIEVKDGV